MVYTEGYEMDEDFTFTMFYVEYVNCTNEKAVIQRLESRLLLLLVVS
jgi:hypothetical protein